MDNLDFRAKLEVKYGPWRRDAAQFGNASYGDIANELCYSNSHFTKLMSGSASPAMYARAMKNLDQLIRHDAEAERLEQLEAERQALLQSNKSIHQQKKKLLMALGGLALLAALAGIWGWAQRGAEVSGNTEAETYQDRMHPLARYFDRVDKANSKTPFLEPNQVHNFCPCSGFEGVWNLVSPYKMPLPINKPGLYYVARSADVYMKCHRGASEDEKGIKLLGFENIHNEIWLDKTRAPFTEKYFDATTKSYTPEFEKLDFAGDPDFVKIADVYSCFYDEFTITPDEILRNGEPCGRYAQATDQALLDTYQIDLHYLMNNVIGNMTYAACQSAPNAFCNPNDLVEGESIFSFDCIFSINAENLGLGGGYPYKKGYRLIEQNYSSNLLCACDKGAGE